MLLHFAFRISRAAALPAFFELFTFSLFDTACHCWLRHATWLSRYCHTPHAADDAIAMPASYAIRLLFFAISPLH